jgi:branched-chain amino acid transport system substrate-binding protein
MRKLLILSAAVLLLAAACGNSKKTATGSNAPAYTIGILVDQTGPLASTEGSTVAGARAGSALAAKAGVHLNFVIADTESSSSGTMAGAQRLVEEDHVLAVIDAATLGFIASPFLKQHDVPVLGGATTGEWLTDHNMFSVYGPINQNLTVTDVGEIMKMLGATNVGLISYNLPTDGPAIKADTTSVQHAGLKVGYVDGQFPLGGTNAEPAILGMKNAGADGFTTLLASSTNIALIEGTRQYGLNLKAALLPTGYGGDILNGGAAAVQGAQGAYFESSFEPVEMRTAATKQLQTDLRSVGANPEPAFGSYVGYTSVALLLQGLQRAGAHPTQASLITSLSRITNFNAAGLLGSHPLNMGDRTGFAAGPDECTYITQLEGTTFDLVPHAEPFCGSLLSTP